MLVFALAFVATFADLSSSSAVIELNDDDFQDRIGDFDTALVMFYAPWCVHCRALKPQYDRASMELKEKSVSVHLLKVDCTAGGKTTCGTHSVSVYPTLKLFKNGQVLPKNYPAGRRKAHHIVKYMARQAGPGYVELNSKNAYEKFLSPENADDFENRIVGFFKEESPLRKAYLKAADLYRDKFRFGFTTLPALLKKNGDEEGVILFRPKQLHNLFEPSEVKYNGTPATYALEAWLTKNFHSLVDVRNSENLEDFELPLVVAYYNFDLEKDPVNTKYWRNRILKVAKDFSPEFNFAISQKHQNEREIRVEFGLEFPGSDKPIILARDAIGRKFPMTEEFTVESFASFLRKLKNQEIYPYVRSEPIPRYNNKPVKEAVGKNFEEVVTNNGKDTFIQFYIPPAWCAPCMALAPIWKEIGEKMKGEEVVIVEMDSEANDVPLGYQLKPPPTIYWIPKNRQATPLKYDGQQELKDLIKYIAKHATHELKGYTRNGKPRITKDSEKLSYEGSKDRLATKSSYEKQTTKHHQFKPKDSVEKVKTQDKLINEGDEDDLEIEDIRIPKGIKNKLNIKDRPTENKDEQEQPTSGGRTDSKEDGKVIELTDNDFEIQTSKYDFSLVMFYTSSWCSTCKTLEPEFQIAASELAKKHLPIRLVKVDCTKGGKSTCEHSDIESYPTMKIFKKGKFSKDYKGGRDAADIVKYMTRQLGPVALELNTKEAFDRFMSGDDNAVVGFFNRDSTLKKAFLQAADSLETYKFGITSKPELFGQTDGEDFIVLVRPKRLQNLFEPSMLTYSGRGTMSALVTWLKENQHGLVGIKTPDNDEEFQNPLVVAYYNIDFDKNSKNTNYWRNKILKVAKDFAADFTFAISNIKDYRYELESEFGYKPSSSKSPVVYARDEDNRKFVMAGEFSTENFKTFLTKLLKNDLRPYVKSQPAPKDNSKPVKIAVADNFDDVVINNNQDTFIQFYAPWSGHCKKLGPIWDELGERMKDENVAIVKMDADGNDVPSANYKLGGFPTIYWAPKNRKHSPIKYSGERELKDFIEFIAKRATNELKNYDRKGNPIDSREEL